MAAPLFSPFEIMVDDIAVDLAVFGVNERKIEIALLAFFIQYADNAVRHDKKRFFAFWGSMAGVA